jgi:hypothetical protein
MRRASLAGLETQGDRQYSKVGEMKLDFKANDFVSAPGGSFVRRLNLSSLASGNYWQGGDSYGDRERVIVRHVPFVIEGGEGESEEEEENIFSASVSQSSSSPLSYIVPDDLSSLSSVSIDNSVEISVREEGGGMEGSGYQSLDDWRRKRERKHGIVEMGGDRQLRTPFKDTKQV